MSRHSLKNMRAILESLIEKREEEERKGNWKEVESIDRQIKEIEIEITGLESLYDVEN